MPLTYSLIASNTLGASAASVTFSAIPGSFTDLVLRISARGTSGGWNSYNVNVNGNTSAIYSMTRLMSSGSTVDGSNQLNQTTMLLGTNTIPSQDTNLFSNTEIYIPSYSTSRNKIVSSFSVGERNNTTAYITTNTGVAATSSAITSITIANNTSDFVSGSSFFLYGIKNS